MNLNLETADRDVYNVLDWIREIGGFLVGIRRIFGLFLIAMTYKNFETYMTSKLFQRLDQSKALDKSNII